ncbi:Ger(x)C family spore germination protein [Fodinisporobacter ferrooxydans]|uniref:Ger(X)C family spore germination protein n=1 Tax=Fodinisporobacter ferrooxydans TaxID=2901836 RepID=A0ABY4CGU9_9BACL|nr:Ger(x)C family spore germination protein [Alicyclobacillaceae bacterium MYW30-H2]
MCKKKRGSHLALGILLGCSLFGLAGCWDRVEVNDLAISMAASIDSAPGGKIRYSKQIAIPGRMGGGTGGPPTSQGPPYTVLSAVGVDMKDAMQNIQKKLSRRLFLAHRRLFLIGEPLARKGIKDQIDEMSRNPQTRLRTNVVVTKGESLDYLKMGYPFERVPAEGLRKILYGEQSNFEMDIKELMVTLATPGSEAFVPIITLGPPATGAAKSFKADGLAVFRSGKMVGTLTAHQERGVLWLRNQINRATITIGVPGHKGKISMNLLRVQSDYGIKKINGHPAMYIRFVPEDDILENNTDLDLSNPKNIALVERIFSAKIQREIKESLDILQHRYHSDIVKFGDRVHHAYPQEWNTWVKHWDREFARMPVTVVVNAKVRRVGMTGPSLTRMEGEIEH